MDLLKRVSQVSFRHRLSAQKRTNIESQQNKSGLEGIEPRMMDNADEWVPEIVVGVDFGMTCTGVAYSFGPQWSNPQPLQHWLGRLPSELANKVPTCIEYYKDSVEVKNWGFGCDHQDEDPDIKEYFKLHLAPQAPKNWLDAPTKQHAQQWFHDYIRAVHRYVVKALTDIFPLFPSRRVEFIFSVPTTWKDQRTIAEIKDLLERAICSSNSSYRVNIGLTEAEAAAVYACQQMDYQRGDIILVCDAGGGTTDINALKILSSPGNPTALEQLNYAEGGAIGSTFIDKDIDELICQRLERIRGQLRKSPEEISWKMTTGRFQRFKHSFGSSATSIPVLKLDVPTLGQESSFAEAEIYNGQMNIASDDIQRSFDSQFDRMRSLIDDQIHYLKIKRPQEQISSIVLSGGFGSSEYLKSRFIERYAMKPIMEGMQILTVDEPQLAVVCGLVRDRTQQLERGENSFCYRRCPVSYGIVIDQRYDPQKHIGEPVRVGKFDKIKYAENQISWVLLQGEAIPPSGTIEKFERKVDPFLLDIPWRQPIVMSTMPPDRLPQSLSQAGATVICDLRVNMEHNIEKKLKNHHWYTWKPKYWKVKFDIQFVVGAADLKFQLWSNNQRISGSLQDAISVNWELATEDSDELEQNLRLALPDVFPQ
ncbi:hypothetical protein FQN57_003811 [Myotisia sp. PD_48]|nr:hypothetical protein FQN57_003811 [Myotisia sp. PD_48]